MAAQPRHIVVGFDGTNGAVRALERATQLMGYGSTMTVVNVGAQIPAGRDDPLASARDLLLEQLISARYERRVGDPAEEIVHVASDLDADVIVVGRRGPEESNGSPQGSVSAAVLRIALCDVLVVT